MLDKPCDVWSVGVIMYNLLSGDQPFEGENRHLVENAILNKKLNFPISDFKNVSKEAKDLMTKLMTKDPGERITAADALQEPWFHEDMDLK